MQQFQAMAPPIDAPTEQDFQVMKLGSDVLRTLWYLTGMHKMHDRVKYPLEDKLMLEWAEKGGTRQSVRDKFLEHFKREFKTNYGFLRGRGGKQMRIVNVQYLLPIHETKSEEGKLKIKKLIGHDLSREGLNYERIRSIGEQKRTSFITRKQAVITRKHNTPLNMTAFQQRLEILQTLHHNEMDFKSFYISAIQSLQWPNHEVEELVYDHFFAYLASMTCNSCNNYSDNCLGLYNYPKTLLVSPLTFRNTQAWDHLKFANFAQIIICVLVGPVGNQVPMLVQIDYKPTIKEINFLHLIQTPSEINEVIKPIQAKTYTGKAKTNTVTSQSFKINPSHDNNAGIACIILAAILLTTDNLSKALETFRSLDFENNVDAYRLEFTHHMLRGEFFSEERRATGPKLGLRVHEPEPARSPTPPQRGRVLPFRGSFAGAFARAPRSATGRGGGDSVASPHIPSHRANMRGRGGGRGGGHVAHNPDVGHPDGRADRRAGVKPLHWWQKDQHLCHGIVIDGFKTPTLLDQLNRIKHTDWLHGGRDTEQITALFEPKWDEHFAHAKTDLGGTKKTHCWQWFLFPNIHGKIQVIGDREVQPSRKCNPEYRDYILTPGEMVRFMHIFGRKWQELADIYLANLTKMKGHHGSNYRWQHICTHLGSPRDVWKFYDHFYFVHVLFQTHVNNRDKTKESNIYSKLALDILQALPSGNNQAQQERELGCDFHKQQEKAKDIYMRAKAQECVKQDKDNGYPELGYNNYRVFTDYIRHCCQHNAHNDYELEIKIHDKVREQRKRKRKRT